MSTIPSIDINTSALYKALGDWLVSMLGPGVSVEQGQLNRVSMPNGNYIYMTLIGPSTDLHKGARNYVWDGIDAAEEDTKSTEAVLQLDFYGSNARDSAKLIQLLVSTQRNFDYFASQAASGGLDMQPMYAGPVRNLSLINGEGQYEQRWGFDLHFQYNPVITFQQDFMDGLDAHAVSVESQFPLE